ncbi:PREDICTED: protein giant [Rhagoletis zephyria]|uniref:protein giant n=1 Tax=Rhagoletis zephyria TaxID=28612 RepID=UPI00081146E6|nr:PREDICTED: protein giant [Rhagoletis zephyria]XP_036339046.1 protein giant [Rhagoletis pomonella]
MMIHEKLMTGQFLLDFKNDHNILHSTSSQHARLSHQQPLYPHHQTYSPGHPLSHHALHQTQTATLTPAKIEQLELYSAYAYRQQQQQQALIGGGGRSHAERTTSQRQSPSEVLDLSRRDSVETTRKTPSPYNTNSSFGADSPAGSPTNSQLQPPMIPSNLLYSAQQQFNRLAPPLASLYPALYSSFGQLTKENTVATSSTTPPMAPLASTITPPATSSPLLAAQSQTSPIPNTPLSVAPSSMLHSIKSEDEHMTPLSPSSSHDGRSKSPTTETLATLAPANPPTTPSALKSTRPFKAFPRDPLVIAANFAATDVLLDNPRVERYTEYRKRVLEQIRSCNGGSRTITNPKMRRLNSRRNSNTSSNAPEGGSSENDERHGGGADESSDCDSSYAGGQGDKVSSSANGNNASASNNSSSGGQIKDAAYYERRRKNNAAAKKSRDRRRIKEDEIAIRAAYLERQNIELLCQIDALKAQLAAFTSKVVTA